MARQRKKSWQDLANQYRRIMDMMPSSYQGGVYNRVIAEKYAPRVKRMDNALRRYSENMNAIDRKNGRDPGYDPGASTRKFTRNQYMGINAG